MSQTTTLPRIELNILAGIQPGVGLGLLTQTFSLERTDPLGIKFGYYALAPTQQSLPPLKDTAFITLNKKTALTPLTSSPSCGL